MLGGVVRIESTAPSDSTMLKPTIIHTNDNLWFTREGICCALSQTQRPFDQPDKVIDVKSCKCQCCEHIGVGVRAGSKDFSLLLRSVSSVLTASSVNLFHSRFKFIVDCCTYLSSPVTLNISEIYNDLEKGLKTKHKDAKPQATLHTILCP